MEILLGSTLREVERVAVEEYAIPISALMQNAAQALYEVCSEKAGAPPAKILILAGSGNNGGDALAAAKILISNGYNVSVLLAADSRPTQLCAAHRIALQELGADISEISSK
ncbi:MAG: NAD(P)H-hydrate epimerase, partial [Deferribacteraceae bacterium]|nr:NAD(P)H-hydrate epimerase [Deferribacteraceae bacterium]